MKKTRKLTKVLAVCLFASLLMGCSSGTSQQGATEAAKTEKTEEKQTETKMAEETQAAETVSSETAAPDEAAANDPYEIKVWMFPLGGDEKANEEREMYDRMIAEFESQNEGLTVDLQLLPWDNRETKMMTAIAAGKGPDCVYLNPDILKLFQYNGVLEPMTPYLDDEFKSSFSESILSQVSVDGEIYGAPALVDVGVPVYNLDLLEKVGVTKDQLPKTWDEYNDLMVKLGEKDIPGVYYQYSTGPLSSYTYAMWFCYGADVITEDGKVTIDDENGKKVLNMITDWYKKGYTPKDSLSVFDQDAAFLSGKVASTLSPDGVAFFMRKGENINFNWAPGPVLEGPAGKYTMSTCGSIAVTKNTKNAEAAAKWAQFFVSQKNNDEWTKFAGLIPARKDAVNPYPDNEGISIAFANVDAVKGEPNHAASRTISPVFVSNIQAMCNDSVTVDQGIADMKKGFEEIITGLEALKPE